MKLSLVAAGILLAMTSGQALAHQKVFDEDSLRNAIEHANSDASVKRIVFKRNANIVLSEPVIYSGTQSLKLIGNNATIDGSSAGSFVLDEDLTAVTEDGTLVFNTAGNITIKRLNVENSATRGVVVNIPTDATGDDIQVKLENVSITDSALFGLHVDDNSDEFDDGSVGSDIGIDLKLIRSTFTGNGTGAIDFDGVRVDERGNGDINAVIQNTHIDGNGGDGMELDEAGDGDVNATLFKVTFNGNGFYNEEDLDDGFDIDEADGGDIDLTLVNIEVNDNMDEGLDFDEAGDGDIELRARKIYASNNSDEAIKLDEEDDGDIEAKLRNVFVNQSGDDGIQFTELGEGKIEANLKKVSVSDSAKYGIKMEQWIVEDEEVIAEEAGTLKVRKVILSGNDKGDEIKVNNIDIE